MKKLAFLLITLISFTFISCKKPLDYKEEVFIQKYIKIYGNWQYKYSVSDSGVVHKVEHTIAFIPFGKFQYNNGTIGPVKIITQDDNMLLLDFGSLFPNVSWASMIVSSTGDSLNLGVVNGLSSLYIRIPE